MSPLGFDSHATNKASACEKDAQGGETANAQEDAAQAPRLEAVAKLQEVQSRSKDPETNQDRRQANRSLNQHTIRHRHTTDQQPQIPDEDADEP